MDSSQLNNVNVVKPGAAFMSKGGIYVEMVIGVDIRKDHTMYTMMSVRRPAPNEKTIVIYYKAIMHAEADVSFSGWHAL